MFARSACKSKITTSTKFRNTTHVLNQTKSNRRFSTNEKTGKGLRFESYGTPEAVLQLTQFPLSAVQANQVLVKILASPINPSDINIIEGTYGVKSSLPAFGGNEGVAEVIAVGSNVTQIKTGDRVVPAKSGLGFWRTHAVLEGKDVRVVPSSIPVEQAACISVNPPTALRLLEDFVPLKAGDFIVQNGANSMVGQSVIQLAKLKKVKTINIIRERGEFDKQVERLKELGGDIVVSEDYFKSPQFRRLIKDAPAPKLALNAVGGATATEMVRVLGSGGTLVTYGGMSREPVTVPTRHLIFNNISLKGFWLTKWLEEHSEAEKQAMFKQVLDLVSSSQLRLRTETWDFQYWEQGFKRLKEPRDRKLVFKM